MTMKWLWVSIFLLSFPWAARAQEPASIRERLEALHVSFSPEGFIEQIRRGDADRVSLFLEAGMSPNVQDKSGRPALIWAAGNGQVAVIEQLLQRGADLCGAGGRAQSALLWAASNGRTEAAHALLKAGGGRVKKIKRG